MNPDDKSLSDLARRIAESEASLEALELEIQEVGQPAAHELKHRLESLKIEEDALKRNLAEALDMGEAGDARMERVEALLAYIQREEASMAHDADFLHQSPPTSAEIAAKAGTRLVDFCLRGLKRVVGKHHPLGMSVFVNHDRANLHDLYGIDGPENGDKPV